MTGSRTMGNNLELPTETLTAAAAAHTQPTVMHNRLAGYHLCTLAPTTKSSLYYVDTNLVKNITLCGMIMHNLLLVKESVSV